MHSLKIKTLKQIFLEYKHVIQIMCGYLCTGFIDFMLKGKTLTEYTNLFSPNNFKKNDAIKMGDFNKIPNISKFECNSIK